MDRDNIRESSRDFFADIVHSICQDVLEELISQKVCDRTQGESIIGAVAKSWVQEGFKIKKRPAPRKPIVKKSTSDYVQISDSYYYLSTLKLQDGLYPLYDTDKGVFVATYSVKEGTYFPLTPSHERILASRSLPLDPAFKLQ